ncbi:hypothetical protein [Streptomyces sp. NRRL S-37]|uniref:hypothetical protein n=1 Tax=Streptomyces sp. NRRL S-37 TaxID=1463903 RepID=UPI0004C9FA91|nr:hypothetical protein [Streptomyces sp. NRRL S-37]
MWVAVIAAIVLLVLMADRPMGPMPFLLIPLVFGFGLGGRFVWAAVFYAENPGTRIFVAILGLIFLFILGYFYGRTLVRGGGVADILFLGLRVENRMAVRPVGRAEKLQWSVLVTAHVAGAVVGLALGWAMLR